MEKLYASKTFWKMAGGKMHTPHPTPQAISYRNHQKTPACFSHLAPLILFFFTKRHSQKGTEAWRTMPTLIRSCLYISAYKGLNGRFPKNGLDKKKVFVVRDEAL